MHLDHHLLHLTMRMPTLEGLVKEDLDHQLAMRGSMMDTVTESIEEEAEVDLVEGTTVEEAMATTMATISSIRGVDTPHQHTQLRAIMKRRVNPHSKMRNQHITESLT